MDDPRAAAELGGRPVRGVRAAHRVEDVVRDVQSEVNADRSDQREDRGPPHRVMQMERRDRDAEKHRDRGGRHEREPRRTEEQPAARELRLHGASLALAEVHQVPARLWNADLRVLEERDLLLVPRLRSVGGELHPAVRAPERSPERDVAALVVAHPGLRTDVA